jgi:nucleoid DNA-binding protein
MNNKELILKLAMKMYKSNEEIQDLMDVFIDSCVSLLKEEKNIEISKFGNFTVEKKEEFISENPITKEKTLNPPKLELNFKLDSDLSENINSNL